VAVATIHGYQATLSPVLTAAGFRCRFTTSCSRYAEVVIARDGLVRGGVKAAARLARCGPWTPAGTVDEP
jgi:putative membrane protein insertion efficiency factor